VCDVFSPVWVSLFALTKYAGIVKAHITTSPTSRVCFEYPKDTLPFCKGMMDWRNKKPESRSSRHSQSLRKDTEAATGRRLASEFCVLHTSTDVYGIEKEWKYYIAVPIMNCKDLQILKDTNPLTSPLLVCVFLGPISVSLPSVLCWGCCIFNQEF